MNRRQNGPLDALINAMPNKRVGELAKAAHVHRNTITKWQEDPSIISLGNRMKLDFLALQLGVKLLLPDMRDRGGSDQQEGKVEGKTNGKVT